VWTLLLGYVSDTRMRTAGDSHGGTRWMPRRARRCTGAVGSCWAVARLWQQYSMQRCARRCTGVQDAGAAVWASLRVTRLWQRYSTQECKPIDDALRSLQLGLQRTCSFTSMQTSAVHRNGTGRMCLKRPSTVGQAVRVPASGSRKQQNSCQRQTAALQRALATLPTRGHRDDACCGVCTTWTVAVPFRLRCDKADNVPLMAC
jgi:hypothetical protein